MEQRSIWNDVKIEYIRAIDSFTKSKPVGCIAAYVKDDHVYFGVSICHEDDKWDKTKAREFAYDRAILVANDPTAKFRLPATVSISWRVEADVPCSLFWFMARMSTYYKDKIIVFPRIEWF